MKTNECDGCKANAFCMSYVKPGSLICTINKMNFCGTHAEETENQQKLRGRQVKYCKYCGHPLKTIGEIRCCDNPMCINRFEPV